MKIITENDILVQNPNRNMDWFWSPASGKKKGGGLMDKAKGLVGSGKVQGVLAALSNNQGGSQNIQPIQSAPLPPEKKGLSKSAKWGIGIGIGVVVLVGGYLLYKKYGKKK